jgi:enoyl-CoA hydratase
MGEAKIDVEAVGRGVLVARIHSEPLGLFVPQLADRLADLVTAADADDSVRAVVLTGTHPERFISHASIKWLQEGGRDAPSVGARAGSAAVKLGAKVRRTRVLEPAARRTSLAGVLELDRLHDTLVRMNSSGTIFVAALNGSALGFGAELAWACDVRLMVAGDHFIGQPEILLGFNPGGGGTQRLTRLVGTQRSLLAILEGRPFTSDEAVEIGAVDELVPADRLIERASDVGARLGSRPKDAIRAVKRSVYLGGSMSLVDGLQLERTEFLGVLGGAVAQERMIEYRNRTAAEGELPLYDASSYEEALETGRLPAQ